MKRVQIRLAAILILWCVPILLLAQTPSTISYQGYLTDAQGIPIDETVDLAIKLFGGGSMLWSEEHFDVPVSNGVFDLVLGGQSSLENVPFASSLELEITVNSEQILPRVLLTSVPYALGLRHLRIIPHAGGLGPTIIGGHASNNSSAGGATIAGGGIASYPNVVTSSYGTVSGGQGNEAGNFGTVGGGAHNHASGFRSTISGGDVNSSEGEGATVGGGSGNHAYGIWSTASGGGNNRVAGDYAAVAGGYYNRAPGDYAAVPGGEGTHARGAHSFAAGYQARAIHEGTFVWADRSAGEDSLLSTDRDQFLIRANGGVGVGTNDPDREITVEKAGAAFQNFRDGTHELLLGVDANGGIVSVMTDHDLVLRAGANQDVLRVAADRNIGIGTDNPGGALHILKEGTPPGSLPGSENGLLLGVENVGGYKWIQSYGGTLSLNPVGNTVAVGKTSTSYAFDVAGTINADEYDQTSDRRLKDDIRPIEDALKVVRSLQGVQFEWSKQERSSHLKDEGTQYGLVAQDVAEILPELVRQNSDGFYALSYTELIPFLIEAIQEQQRQIDALMQRTSYPAPSPGRLDDTAARYRTSR